LLVIGFLLVLIQRQALKGRQETNELLRDIHNSLLKIETNSRRN
jgi:hypothetical protein